MSNLPEKGTPKTEQKQQRDWRKPYILGSLFLGLSLSLAQKYYPDSVSILTGVRIGVSAVNIGLVAVNSFFIKAVDDTKEKVDYKYLYMNNKPSSNGLYLTNKKRLEIIAKLNENRSKFLKNALTAVLSELPILITFPF
ncbi:MAG: hypothetical protein WCK31_00075 [bacterium]